MFHKTCEHISNSKSLIYEINFLSSDSEAAAAAAVAVRKVLPTRGTGSHSRNLLSGFNLITRKRILFRFIPFHSVYLPFKNCKLWTFRESSVLHEDFLRSAAFNANVNRNDEVFVEMGIKFYVAICHDVVIILRFIFVCVCVFVQCTFMESLSFGQITRSHTARDIYNTCVVPLFMAALTHILTLIFVHLNHGKYYDLDAGSPVVNLFVLSLLRWCRRMFVYKYIKTKWLFLIIILPQHISCEKL